jgi:hypothetical protein
MGRISQRNGRISRIRGRFSRFDLATNIELVTYRLPCVSRTLIERILRTLILSDQMACGDRAVRNPRVRRSNPLVFAEK